MATLIQVWGTVPHTPVGAVAKGEVVLQNGLLGIATKAIAAGALGELATSFTATLPKATGGGSAILAGKAVFWDGSVVTETVSTNTRAGVTALAAADGDATVVVLGHAGVLSLTEVTEAAVVAALTDSTTGTGATTTLAARSINFTGYANTFTHNSGVAVNIGTTTAGFTPQPRAAARAPTASTKPVSAGQYFASDGKKSPAIFIPRHGSRRAGVRWNGDVSPVTGSAR